MPYQRANSSMQNYQKPNNKVPFQTTGTINAIGSAGMRIDANGSTWNVTGDKNCKIEVTGTVDPSFLKPGMLVRFTGEFDKKGKTTAPVSDIEIVSQQNAMVPEGSHGSTRLSKKSLAATPTGSATIVGQLKEFKNNEMTVESGNGAVKADVSPTASIKVDVTDPRLAEQLAQTGDKVDVRGYCIQGNTVVAEDVRITLSSAQSDKKPTTKPGEKPAATSAAN